MIRLALLAVVLSGSSALAQATPPARSDINECTLLSDAAELQRCIEDVETHGPGVGAADVGAASPRIPPANDETSWLKTKGRSGSPASSQRPGKTLDLRDQPAAEPEPASGAELGQPGD